jgi:thiamine-phosphate pyrophosphorylase
LSQPDLRLIVITDPVLAAPRSIERIVRECLEAGAPAIQLRDKSASAAELLEQALRLRELSAGFGATLFVNDRLDVALAARAAGVHLGPDDVPIVAARAVVDTEFLVGCSTDDPASARAHQNAGASYIGCGAVFATSSKAEVADEQIGPEGLRAVVQAVTIPVIGIGGVTPENVQQIAEAGAAGCAVIRALMTSPTPGQTTAALLSAFPVP